VHKGHKELPFKGLHIFTELHQFFLWFFALGGHVGGLVELCHKCVTDVHKSVTNVKG
jgi:hypothetical protein